MDDREWLAERFEMHRGRLRAVALRMLGSTGEADDAVQESWLRLTRVDAAEVENLGAWLTTVVARVSLDMLRSRTSRRERPLDTGIPEAALAREGGDPEGEAVLADSVGLALLVVLETLTPAERLAFVLHDMFAVSFDEIAPIVGRSTAAARQLASRARRRVQRREGDVEAGSDRARQTEIVTAFLAASRGGNFESLLTLLDPDVVLRADAAAVKTGAATEVRGARAVATTFSGRARFAEPALIDGVAGLAWMAGGRPRVVFTFAVANGKIAAIDLIADAGRIGVFNLVLPNRD